MPMDSSFEILPSREGQHPLRQRGTALGAGHGIFHEPLRLLIARHVLAQEFEASHDDCQQIVEVVGYASRQAAQGVHLLRLDKRFAGLLEFDLSVAPFRDVPRDLGEADDRPVVIANGIDDHVRPELAPVLANAERLGLKAPFVHGRGQTFRRLSSLLIVLRIKRRKVPSDDFVGGVAFDFLRADVPVRHPSFRIEHVDGVVGHALHE